MEDIADQQADPVRLDAHLLKLHPELTRSQAQRLIKEGYVEVDGKVVSKSSYRVNFGQVVTANLSIFDQSIQIDEIDMPVLYEDKDCVVINKPLGVLTHSKGVLNPEATVATWLAGRQDFVFQEDESDPNQRKGIVHRLDRATSGVMICAKNQNALRHLQKQFQDRKAKKTYVARVEGQVSPAEALIDLPIERNPKQPQRFRVGQNGKEAQTTYFTLKTIKNDTLLELKPRTGRTHQLRVHLDYIGHPIVGDTFYEGRKAERLFLHAHQLEITLPNKERQTFVADIPRSFYGEST